MWICLWERWENVNFKKVGIDEFIESWNWPEDSQIIETRQKKLNFVHERNALKRSWLISLFCRM